MIRILSDLLRWILRPRRSPSAGGTRLRVTVVDSTGAPFVIRPMGFRECALDRWRRDALDRPVHRQNRWIITRLYMAWTHNLDHTSGLLAKAHGRQPYTLEQMLSWPSIDLRELARHSLFHEQRVITPN